MVRSLRSFARPLVESRFGHSRSRGPRIGRAGRPARPTWLTRVCITVVVVIGLEREGRIAELIANKIQDNEERRQLERRESLQLNLNRLYTTGFMNKA